ncbi:hypothetical protein GCM10020255_041930 [Rhodococcus baikonurensis]
MGIQLPVLWALLSFITNYIPNIGFVIGVIPPALLGLLQGGPWLMLWVIVVYSVINFVIQSIIQPKFVGDAVGLSVTMTFLSLVFWSWVLGALGALLAIPLSLLVKAVLLDIDPATRWADILISGPRDMPKEEPEEPEKPQRPHTRALSVSTSCCFIVSPMSAENTTENSHRRRHASVDGWRWAVWPRSSRLRWRGSGS